MNLYRDAILFRRIQRLPKGLCLYRRHDLGNSICYSAEYLLPDIGLRRKLLVTTLSRPLEGINRTAFVTIMVKIGFAAKCRSNWKASCARPTISASMIIACTRGYIQAMHSISSCHDLKKELVVAMGETSAPRDHTDSDC